MEKTLAQRLQEYILNELTSAAYYTQLSYAAPNAEYRQALLTMAQDEITHADYFKEAYRMLTGEEYNPVVPIPRASLSFIESIHDMLLEEISNFQAYGHEYVSANGRNEMLGDIFYLAWTDANMHALKLLYILAGINGNIPSHIM